ARSAAISLAAVVAGALAVAGDRGQLISNGDRAEGDLLEMLRRRLLQFFPVLALAVTAAAQSGGELRFSLRNEPKTFNPILVQDDSSETVRYLTGGVLVRVYRKSQQLEPSLATPWTISNAGKPIPYKIT